MSETFQEGDVVEGIVTGVQPYGAFISFGNDVQGLVHISEITNGYVKDIHYHVVEGEKVNVKIIDKDEEAHKYALSIRALESEQQKKAVRLDITENEGEHGFHTLQAKLQEWMKKFE